MTSSSTTVAAFWQWKGTLNGFPNGAPSYIRNPGGGWGDICPQWCPTSADRIFKLYGSSNDPPPPPPVPAISAIVEPSATRSGRFVITGTGFTDTDHLVLLNGKPTPHATWTETEIHAYALGDAALGLATVQVVTAGGSSDFGSIVIEPMPRTSGRVKWRFQADAINISHRVGVTSGGAVHFSDNGGNVYALDAQGGLKWIFNMIGGGNEGPAVVGADDTIYVAGNPLGPDVVIHALDPDGALRWTFVDTNTEGVIAGPAVGPDGNIYVVTDLGGLGALSLSPDGDLLWSNAGSPTFQEFAQIGAEIVFGTQGPDGEAQLCVAFDEGILEDRVYALALDGTQRFQAITGSGDDPVAQFQVQPAIGAPDGSIYVVDFGPGGGAGWSLKSFDPEDGSLKWTALDEGTNTLTAPTTGPDGTVYVVRNLGQLHALTPDGASLWIRQTSSIYQIGVVAPDNSILVLGGSPDWGMAGFIEGVRVSDGEPLWKVDLPQEAGGIIVASSRATFSAGGDTVYVGTAHLVPSGNSEYSYLYAIETMLSPSTPADLDGDGNVDGADLGLMLGSWGGTGAADLDGDGTVDGADLGLLLGAWTG